MEVGTKALGAGKKQDAAEMFEKAYDLYSLFWGLNMHLIDLDGVHESVPAFYDGAMAACKTPDVKKSTKTSDKDAPEHVSTVKKLGNWVKKAVNCCIE